VSDKPSKKAPRGGWVRGGGGGGVPFTPGTRLRGREDQKDDGGLRRKKVTKEEVWAEAAHFEHLSERKLHPVQWSKDKNEWVGIQVGGYP